MECQWQDQVVQTDLYFIIPELADEPLHVFFLLCKDCSLYKDECH